jgi:hypothetical protein
MIKNVDLLGEKRMRGEFLTNKKKEQKKKGG